MTRLTRLVYRSTSNISHDDGGALDAIFRTSRRNNRRDRITGALALPDGKFVQAIEGPTAHVEDLIRRLRADVRHRDIQVLGSWPITDRLFADWAMARPDPTPLGQQAFRIITEVGSGAQVTGVLINLIDEGRQPFF